MKDPTTKADFELETHNRFTALLQDWKANQVMPNEIWTEMRKAYTEIAEAKLGRKKSKPLKPFISEEVFRLAKEKSNARKSNNKEEYKRLKKEVRTKLRRDKAAWLERECSLITEANAERQSKKLFQQIKKLKPSGP